MDDSSQNNQPVTTSFDQEPQLQEVKQEGVGQDKTFSDSQPGAEGSIETPVATEVSQKPEPPKAPLVVEQAVSTTKKSNLILIVGLVLLAISLVVAVIYYLAF